MRTPLWLITLLVTATLAGCSGPPPAEVADEAFADYEKSLEATATTGLIRGVIVDTAITPLAEATATILGTGATAETDDEGRFTFTELEPGMYFIEATKPGYNSVQHSIEVIAGVSQPPIARMMLEQIPGLEPFVTPLHISGIMVCSAQVAVAFATGCLVGAYTDDHSRNYFDVDGVPDFFQSEMIWESTQALARDACMRNYASTDLGGSLLTDDACGPSPLASPASQERLDELGVGAGMGVENVVWVSPLRAEGVPVLGVAIDQRFDVYIHLFYNFAPLEGWTFLDDGEPIPPA